MAAFVDSAAEGRASSTDIKHQYAVIVLIERVGDCRSRLPLLLDLSGCTYC